jgi:ankyrin repeat protein
MLSYLNLECTRFLVESGANLEAKDINGWTAVRFACGNDYLEVTRFLVESGANLEAQDERYRTLKRDVSKSAH